MIDVNPNSKKSLLDFFNKFNKLTNGELAVLVKRSTSTVRRWRRKCGLSVGKKPIEGANRYKRQLPEPPENWDNEAWFREMYEEKNYGIRALALILGRSRTFISDRLDRYNIEHRSHEEATKSKNKFNSKEWLVMHYVDMRWPISKCAEAAGVEKQTIADWLVLYGIKTRESGEALSGRAKS